ncbi:cytochrome P450 4B1-like [Mytilus californianus]|uniref:cytochrome P450 4B1-like n=1 Tax=Mytilus californianus TaxID=6549 RepID=UPI0022456BF7|nr:cytochrome P450 4B1-like [Mytilus californianus]
MAAVLMSIVIGIGVLILAVIIINLIKFLQWHGNMVKTLSHFPGPKTHWLFGNALQIETFDGFFKKMCKEYVEEKRCKAFVYWLFVIRPLLTLTHPDTIKVVMKSTAPKSRQGAGISFMLPWIGESLLVSDGPKWERNRRLLTPAFHFSILNGYFKIYNDVTDTLLEKFAEGSKNAKYVEVFQYSGLATLDILLQCSLSYKGNIQDVGESHPYVKAVKRMIELTLHRCLNINLYPEFLFKLSPSGKEFFKLCDFVHEFSEDIISKRKEDLKENADTEKRRQLDFLDILLTARDESGKGLTDEEIRTEVDTFMFAGHDTTSSVLSWSIYSLGKHKDIQDKVYEEVKRVVGDKQYVDCEDISKMKYLSCFLKEVMRHHTPVPVISRMLDEPCVIEGVEIPKGSFIDMAIHHAHHHPDVWEDPWEFKPERFVGDKHHDMDPYSFTPFSAGPRNCIGQAFAQNEEKVLIARLVNRFEISVDPDHEVEHFTEVVMRAKNGIMACFKERT